MTDIHIDEAKVAELVDGGLNDIRFEYRTEAPFEAQPPLALMMPGLPGAEETSGFLELQTSGLDQKTTRTTANVIKLAAAGQNGSR